MYIVPVYMSMINAPNRNYCPRAVSFGLYPVSSIAILGTIYISFVYNRTFIIQYNMCFVIIDVSMYSLCGYNIL